MNADVQIAALASMVVLDFECTGVVEGHANVPWQIGIERLENGKIQVDAGFQTLLKVPMDHPFNPYAPGRWAQQRSEMASAPTLVELWPVLHPMLANRVLVAHHVPTERGILKQFFPLQKLGPWIDTLTLARKVFPQLPDFRLETIIPALGWQQEVQALAPGRAPHDAFYDAAACAVFLSHVLSLPGWSAATVSQLSKLK